MGSLHVEGIIRIECLSVGSCLSYELAVRGPRHVMRDVTRATRCVMGVSVPYLAGSPEWDHCILKELFALNVCRSDIVSVMS